MSAPDVLYLIDGEFYDETPTAWDASNLQPLVVPEPDAMPAHRDDCWMAHRLDPAEQADVAFACPCTATQRYARRHRAEVAL